MLVPHTIWTRKTVTGVTACRSVVLQVYWLYTYSYESQASSEMATTRLQKLIRLLDSAFAETLFEPPVVVS
jgi:hypothetical protein